MKKPINNIPEGRNTVATILAEYLKHETKDSSEDYSKYELSKLLNTYRKYIRSLPRAERKLKNYFYRISYLVYNYRNIEGHDEASPNSKAKDPIFIASALDSMRIFTDYLVDEINKHRKRLILAPLEKPLYKYKMDQPKNSKTKPDTKNSYKHKAPNYVKIPHYPFDLTRFENVRFDRTHYRDILKELNYFEGGDKILFVQTYGDYFAYYKDRTGYIGDCREDYILINGNDAIEVNKIIVIHFYEGEGSSKAHFYLADYRDFATRREYEPIRYRYSFKNILSCGDIEDGIISDTQETATVIVLAGGEDEKSN